MGLQPKDLEAVLKGRLHQAMILVTVAEEGPGKWPRIKALAQEVLQFDFSNCHARWLRGLALKALGSRIEALEEMRRAVECAKKSGKSKEAEMWEKEIQLNFGGPEGMGVPVVEELQAEDLEAEQSGSVSEVQEVAAAATVLPAVAEAPAPAKAATPASPRPAEQSKDEAQTKGDAPALKKGFFQSGGDKKKKPSASTKQVEVSQPAPAVTSPAKASTGASAAANDGDAKALAAARAAQAAAEEAAEKAQQLVVEKGAELKKQRLELEAVRQQLQEERDQAQQHQQEAQRGRLDLRNDLDSLVKELDELFAAEASAAGGSSGIREARERREAVEMRRARDAAKEARELGQAARSWAESQLEKYVEVSTEVLTLKEMGAREARERKEASRVLVSELDRLTREFGDLKGATRSLRDNVRLRVAGAPRGDKEEPDLQQLSDSIADFRALPFRAKLWALVDDAAVLRLAAFVTLLGMLLILGFFVEGFSSRRCRFICAR